MNIYMDIYRISNIRVYSHRDEFNLKNRAIFKSSDIFCTLSEYHNCSVYID